MKTSYCEISPENQVRSELKSSARVFSPKGGRRHPEEPKELIRDLPVYASKRTSASEPTETAEPIAQRPVGSFKCGTSCNCPAGSQSVIKQKIDEGAKEKSTLNNYISD